MCMSESQASRLLRDVKWLEFADVSERLVVPIMRFKRMSVVTDLDIWRSRRGRSLNVWRCGGTNQVTGATCYRKG